MWRRTALIVVIGLTLASRSRSMGQESNCPRLLLSDLNWVRFDVIMGRVVAVKNRAKQDRQRARRELPCGITESVSICIDRGLTSLQYALDSDALHLDVRVVRRDEVEIRCERGEAEGSSTSMTYTQIPGEDVQITVATDGEAEQFYRAPSLWHLVVSDAAIGDLLLLEVLQQLRRDWRPLSEAEAIRTALIETEPWDVTTSLQEVRLLVDQLADRDFRIRRLADRELRSRGRAVLCLLNELDPNQLDGEQRMRIREIRRALIGDVADTPERVTAWLVNDKCLWLALLDHQNMGHRLAARQHLARIVDRPIQFDPGARPAIRSEQLAALRSQLAIR